MDETSLSLSLTNNPRERKDSSDDENSQAVLLPAMISPQSKFSNKILHVDESSTLPGDVSVDYWTIIDHQKEKKDGVRTIKSSLKSNIRVLTITRQATMNSDGKISPSLTMTFVTGEKKQKSKGNYQRREFQLKSTFSSDEIRKEIKRFSNNETSRTSSHHWNQSTCLYIEITKCRSQRYEKFSRHHRHFHLQFSSSYRWTRMG